MDTKTIRSKLDAELSSGRIRPTSAELINLYITENGANGYSVPHDVVQ